MANRTGTLRWLQEPDNADYRVLEITVKDAKGEDVKHVYDVTRADGGGFNLSRVCSGDVVTYHVVYLPKQAGWACNCPDAQHRGKFRCKHARALPIALQRLPF